MQTNIFTIFKPYKKLVAVVSERKDGSMKLVGDSAHDKKVHKNQEEFLKKLKIKPEEFLRTNSVHNGEVRLVEKEDKGIAIAQTEGLITDEKKVYLSITVADCLPIFFYEPKKEVIALIHAGWKELKKNIIKKTVKLMTEEFEVKPLEILVAIGPAICEKCYEVGEEVLREFRDITPTSLIKKEGKIFFDLKKSAKTRLVSAGIEARNIELSRECTHCLPEKYFSYRRDKPKIMETEIAVMGMR